MKDFLIKMFGESDVSIKRVISLIGFLFLGVTMLLNSFQHEDIKPSGELVDAVKEIVFLCITGNVVEKFLKKKAEESN